MTANYGKQINCEAASAISVCRFVKPTAVPTGSAVCKVAQCAAATDWPIGVSAEAQATTGNNLLVDTPYAGIVEIEVGAGGVTILDNLTSDANGKAITASAGDNYMARALSTAAAGDRVIAMLYGSEVTGLFIGNIGVAGGTTTVLGGLRVGTGSSPDVALGDDDLFVEGTAEFDGAVRIDGAADLNSTLDVAGVVTISAGAVDAPSLAKTGDTNTGFWFSAADKLNVSCGGVEVGEWDGSGYNGVIGATTPAAGAFTTLAATGGAIAAKVVTSALDDLVANTTTRTTVFVATSNCVVTKASIAFYAKPASTLGTVLGNLKAWDASGDAEHVLQETADLDLEGITDKEGTAITLQTSNPEYLELDEGDTVYYESVSNNADMTGGTDGVLTLEVIYD